MHKEITTQWKRVYGRHFIRKFYRSKWQCVHIEVSIFRLSTHNPKCKVQLQLQLTGLAVVCNSNKCIVSLACVCPCAVRDELQHSIKCCLNFLVFLNLCIFVVFFIHQWEIATFAIRLSRVFHLVALHLAEMGKKQYTVLWITKFKIGRRLQCIFNSAKCKRPQQFNVASSVYPE